MFDSINEMQIPIPHDENGMVGRECPNSECLGFFKIKLGTGILEEGYNQCFCPYCGYKSTQEHFLTQEQLNYAKSIAIRETQNALEKEFRKWDRQLRSGTRNSFIKLSVEYKKNHQPIAYYAEPELETHLTCENCGLVYAVYGKFAYCPNCGADNTLQILKANLELVRKMIAQIKSQEDPEFREYLIHTALGNVVSAFDSFGKNTVTLFTKHTEKSEIRISFQNIIKAGEKIQKEFGLDIYDGLGDEKWQQIVVNFQKRHLISHNDAIVDEVYLTITSDRNSILGRAVIVSIEDIEDMLDSIEYIAKKLQSGLVDWKVKIK
ncbi:MAG: hypothetical protein K8R77_11315 [Anaerolineaceae bacterium]|nr:hypothetical protein [Anaerolineaceae bacterium]